MPNSLKIELPETGEPLACVLGRIGRELAEVADTIERFESHLCAMPSDDDMDAGRVQALQGIDLSIQKLRGLAEFIGLLRDGVPDDCLVDMATALNVVKLTDMQRRLASAAGVAPVASVQFDKVAGDVDLF